MSTVVVHQAWFELLAFWRSARGRCFTLALPVKLSAIVLAAIVGAGSFASLGYALASLIRSSSVTTDPRRPTLRVHDERPHRKCKAPARHDMPSASVSA
jgi:hypothetical protein